MANSRLLRANVLLLLASAIWGFAFVAQRIGADYVGPFTFSAVRFAMGAVVMIVVIKVLDWKRGLSKARRAAATRMVLWPGLACGTLLAAAVGFQQASMPQASAGDAAFITALYIVIVPIFGLFFGRRIGWQLVVGVAACVVGMYLICITDDLVLGTSDLLLLAAATVFAIQIMLVDRYTNRVSALRFATAQFVSCAVISAVLALLLDPVPFGGLDQAVIPLIYGGVGSVGIAYTLQVLGQRDALASHAALIMSLEAVFGGLGGALILNEDMGQRGYIGAALMVAGILVSHLGTLIPSKRKQEAPSG
ncbi:MAG: DMT family transporter [Propionibacteriaceae bacterium]|nr:DMT family transporter [Propionibacteriaceae bacterium]